MDVGPKQLGRCPCCGTECYEILECHVGGPLDGHPKSLGPQRECGTQIEFLLSDGTEADITCCIDCAGRLLPQDYQSIWEAIIDRVDLSCRLAKQSENERRRAVAQYTRIWPVALLRCRVVDPETNSLRVDRRWKRA